MADGDVIIESAYADEFETLYGDANDTMTDADGTDSAGRPTPVPYLRLDSLLRNITRDAGQTARLRCAAIGSPLPIEFAWFKNNAPLELRGKRKRIRVKNRDYQSRLIIQKLEVLDSGYYRCEASNSVGSVNTTGVIKVRPVRRQRPTTSTDHRPLDQSGSSANQNGGFDLNLGNGDWLLAASVDGRSRRLRNNTCVPYGGTACADYLRGYSVLVVSSNMEDMLDIERNVIATGVFIERHPSISTECKSLSQKVGCFHRFNVCAPSGSGSGSSQYLPPSGYGHSEIAEHEHVVNGANRVMRICADHCIELRDEKCTNEFALARSHGLVGNKPEDLLPDCDSLTVTSSSGNCVPIFGDVPRTLTTTAQSTSTASGIDDKTQLLNDMNRVDDTHFCYVDSGMTYRGNEDTTETGQNCEKWSDIAEKNGLLPSSFLAMKHRYCRNPDNRPRPWCYTSSGSEEFCDVPICKGDLFPKLLDKEKEYKKLFPQTTTTTSPTGATQILNKVTTFWKELPVHWQYSLLGGIAGLILLLLLCVCCCYCRRRRRRKSDRKKKRHQILLNNGSVNGSVVNAPSNGYYHRKLNGSAHSGGTGSGSGHGAHPGGGGAAVELSALLPPPPTSPPPLSATVSEIETERIKFIEPLGEGQFGQVWKGELQCGVDDYVQVAIKTLKDDSSPRNVQEFERELQFAAGLQHTNVVRLLGVCSTVRPKCAVFEYMVHGDLHEFLLLRSPYSLNEQGETVNNLDRERLMLDQSDFLHIATQLSSGMEYLSSCHYVHRDLAARNCLVTDRLTIKIADFGLMRDMYTADYYRMQSHTMLPVRWMPAEAIVYGQFSESSDVWAYGVTLWEIYSYGAQPYFGYTNEQVIELVRNRCLLECPQNCPPRMYSVMVECWHEVASRRPRFAELSNRIQNWSISSPAQSSAMMSHGGGGALGVPPRPGSVNSAATSSTAAAGHHHQLRAAGGSMSSTGQPHFIGHHNNGPVPYTNLLQNPNPAQTTTSGSLMPPPYSSIVTTATTAHGQNNNFANTAGSTGMLLTTSNIANNNVFMGTGTASQAQNVGPGIMDSPRMHHRPLQPLKKNGFPEYDSEDSSDG